ncbi:MAG: hypothetical protein AB7F59_00445 [Bdellovibrionales bacterium]
MKLKLMIAILFLAGSVSGCVSVQIGPKKSEPAKNIKFKAPPEPFVAIDSSDVDHGWKNGFNNTSISFRSACNDGDPSLESIQQSLIFGLEETQILKSQRVPYNEREALNSVISGKVDGIMTKMEFMILKKNGCSYTISYIALDKKFESDLHVFKSFLKNFEAP